MTDIVERLRAAYPGCEPMPLAVEAATEIERLQALFRELRPEIERLEFVESCTTDANTPRLQMLRRALEQARS